MDNNPNEQMKIEARTPEDEIELIDLIRVIWKWKYLIIFGTFLFAGVVAISSLFMSKVYRTDMILQPGILSIGADGKNVYIDTPSNIKALIGAGTFNNEILRTVDKEKYRNTPGVLSFKVSFPGNSNTLKVSYETADIKQGIAILSYLDKLLKDKYAKLVEYFQNEIKMDISLKQAEITGIRDFKKSAEERIKRYGSIINDLKSEIRPINENTHYLNTERNKFIDSNLSENNILSALLYSNTIQQNLQLARSYKNEIRDYEMRREQEIKSMRIWDNEIQKLLAEIDNLNFKMSNIQNIQTLQAPTGNPFPIKPKKKRYVILVAIAGFFILIFASFVLEYIAKNKTRLKTVRTR